ncbi:phosphatase PAP2 family protein [Niameybacter massiliensis]|uniref:Phosphatase PAP2 family protein n=1 Tax=Holtiella tumoricola TaxID=3018743 RepID=A0AA42J315_9FIRM|nr:MULTISPECIES: phosphatase PAP2 family protein [Lachnospirales]MDA3734254.1 phosphatase PAP2 family protein [Holtiella tumoricola]
MNWEISILQGLQAIRTPFLTSIMEAITALAESLPLVLVIGILYWCVEKKKTVRIGWIVLTSSVVNGVIKNLVRAARPFQKGIVSPVRVETATSYSFPSGHTQTATSFWTSAMMIFKNKTTYGIGCTMIILTGLSRIYLGVHWPVDVIGGIIIGLIVVVAADKLYDEDRGFTRWHVIGVGVLAFLFLIVPIEKDLVKAVGALWGFVVGCYIEQNYIHFHTEAPLKKQLFKIAIGLGGAIVIAVAFQFITQGDLILSMLKYGIIVLWLTAGAPYVFKTMLK